MWRHFFFNFEREKERICCHHDIMAQSGVRHATRLRALRSLTATYTLPKVPRCWTARGGPRGRRGWRACSCSLGRHLAPRRAAPASPQAPAMAVAAWPCRGAGRPASRARTGTWQWSWKRPHARRPKPCCHVVRHGTLAAVRALRCVALRQWGHLHYCTSRICFA